MSVARAVSRSSVRAVARAAADRLVVPVFGSASPSIPDGAIGIWYADEFQSSPRMVIPNAATVVPVSQNLLRAPRQLFNNGEFWVKNGATVTDGITSSRVVLATGDSFIFFYAGGHPSLPAGTYTMAIDVKRHGGTNQQFRMSFLHAGLDSSPFTATADWQRFTFTGALSAGTNALLFLRTIDGSTAADLDVRDAALYAGAADLGEPALAGHLYVGEYQYDTRPAYSSGAIDLSADGAYGLIQFADDLALTECTVLTVASKVTNARTYSAALCKPNDQNTFHAGLDISKKAVANFGSGSNSYADIAISAADGFNPNGAGFRFLAHRHDGTIATMFTNETRLLRKTGLSPSTPVSVSQFLVGAYSSVTLTGGYSISSMVLYDRALTDEEIAQAYEALSARAEQAGNAITVASRYLVAVGDSLTVDSTTPSYAHLFHANASPRCYGAVYAQSGGTLTNLISNAAVVDGVLPASLGSNDYILSVLIGTNDLTASSDVPAFLADLAAYCDARRAAGWKVALGTLLPADRSNFNTRRNTANTTIRTWAGVHADVIIDFAANTTIGEDGDELNTTYYSDGVHPTLAGQEIMESIYRTAINGLP